MQMDPQTWKGMVGLDGRYRPHAKIRGADPGNEKPASGVTHFSVLDLWIYHYLQCIAKGNRKHYALQVVVAIRPSVKHIQAQIDLGVWEQKHMSAKVSARFLLQGMNILPSRVQQWNMQTFLEFERPVQHLIEQITKLKEVAAEGEVDVKSTMKDLEQKLAETRRTLYADLSPWERVQLSRHPDRPYTLKYIDTLSEGTFIELHGDRTVKDDKAMVGGFGMMAGRTVMFIGQQKGVNTKMRQYRNFGMPNPEGYRKALRLMKLAEKFGKPVVTLIDTPGAFPGLEAEERGQGEAIARNLMEMAQLRVPIVCVIIGEGASGGALGIGIGDKVLMMENTWYSVISPESCSSILWRSWDYKEQAAKALKLTADDMLANKLIDGIIKEPLGGAHSEPDEACRLVGLEVTKQLNRLVKLDAEKLVERRIRKFCDMGVVMKASKSAAKAKA